MEETDRVWGEVVEAFAHYGKRVRPLKGKRRERIERLLSEGYTSAELVAAVHGYVHRHEGLDPKPDGFKPRTWFTPETIFGPEKLEGRIELGEAGPYRKPLSRSEERQREQDDYFAEARRQVARERGHLRGV